MRAEEAIEPQRDLLLVEKDDPSDDEGTYGVIVAPSTARPDPYCRGRVLRAGPAARVAAGQRIGWGYYSGTGLGVTGEDRELVMLSESEVLFVEQEVACAAS